MKKILTFLALTSFATVFSQISINANLPSAVSAGSTVETDVKIIKGAVGNFAKYQMDVPMGYVVTSVDAKGGNFTFENQRAKIVWVSVPGEAEFVIKFKVEVGSNAVSPGTFVQKFYFLENGEKKEVEASPIVVNIGGDGAVVSNTPVETKITETKPVETKPTETKPVETKPVETKPVETKPVETKTTETKPVETKTATAKTNSSNSTSEVGVSFKVQLGAFTNEPSKSKFSGAGNVTIEKIDGLYKVTTGNFKTKDEAYKRLDELKAKGYSGFVTTYKNGQRIN